MLLNSNATRAFILCFFTILNQKEFRIAKVAMFTCDLYAGVVPQMSPPPHDLERLRTTMVDFKVIFKVKDRVCFAPVFITYNKLYMYIASIFCKTSISLVLYH